MSISWDENFSGELRNDWQISFTHNKLPLLHLKLLETFIDARMNNYITNSIPKNISLIQKLF